MIEKPSKAKKKEKKKDKAPSAYIKFIKKNSLCLFIGAKINVGKCSRIKTLHYLRVKCSFQFYLI
jgi:hypothetical protein